MKPSPELILNQAFAKIAMEMGPALPAGYGQGSATITGVLLLMVAQEFNRAADIRKNENDAMRRLFAETAPRVEGGLRESLHKAAQQEDQNIAVSTLDASGVTLKKLLIELHQHAEKTGDRELDHKIVRLMQNWASARQVFLPAM